MWIKVATELAVHSAPTKAFCTSCKHSVEKPKHISALIGLTCTTETGTENDQRQISAKSQTYPRLGIVLLVKNKS